MAGFEKLCARVKADITPEGYRVRHNVHITGVDSGAPRQIDIMIDSGDEQFFTFLDAKCYSRHVDVKDVEAVMGMAKDVRALKSGIVTTKGFSDAALNVAVANDMELVVLVDTGEHPWKQFANVPLCVSIHTYEFTQLGLRGNIPITELRSGHPYTGKVPLADGKGLVCIADHFLDEVGLGDLYGFNYPECEQRAFQFPMPVELHHSEKDFLILEGVFTKTIDHHQKCIALSEYHGFVNPREHTGEGNWVINFEFPDVTAWPTIPEPPSPINEVHPQFVATNIEHLRSDWDDEATVID